MGRINVKTRKFPNSSITTLLVLVEPQNLEFFCC